MRPRQIIYPTEPIKESGRDPNPLIPFKGKIEVVGKHKLKDGVTATFRLDPSYEDQHKQYYKIEFQLKSPHSDYRTGFYTEELFRPAEHLLHELCIPTLFLEKGGDLDEILLRTYSHHLDQIQDQNGMTVTLFTDKNELSMKISIGKYKGKETLTKEEGITEEALEKLFVRKVRTT
jgi:hypothetical protein